MSRSGNWGISTSIAYIVEHKNKDKDKDKDKEKIELRDKHRQWHNHKQNKARQGKATDRDRSAELRIEKQEARPDETRWNIRGGKIREVNQYKTRERERNNVRVFGQLLAHDY